MVEASEIAVGLGVGLVATEATGITNITGGNSGIPRSPIALPGGGGSQIVNVPDIGGGLKDTAGNAKSAYQLASMWNDIQQNENTTKLAESLTKLRQDLQSNNGPGIGGFDPTKFTGGGSGINWPWEGEGGSGTGGGSTRDRRIGKGGTPTSKPSDFKLQDLYDGSGGIGDGLATVGEAGVAGGSFVNDIVEGSGSIIGGPNKGGILGGSYDLGRLTGEGLNSSYDLGRATGEGIKQHKRNVENFIGGLF